MEDKRFLLWCPTCSDEIDITPEWEHSMDGMLHRLICPKCHRATGWYCDGPNAVGAWSEGAFAQEPAEFRQYSPLHNGEPEPVKFRSITPRHDEDHTFALEDSGDRTEFTSGAVRDMHEGKGRFDLLPMCAIMRLARHYENGCKKYGDRNWEKGIPAHSFADSALRHLMKYMDGWDDEDHLIAAVWNLLGLAWTEEKHPDLIDIPARAGCASF